MRKPPEAKETPVYDLHLEDSELFEHYYSVTYGEQRERDIHRFVSPQNIQGLFQSLFSFPEFKLYEYLMDYCRRIFDHVKEYTFEQVLQLREALSKHQRFSSPSSPFWNPVSAANEEKVIIASLPKQPGDRLHNFVDGMFVGLNTKYIEGENPSDVMLVQISHGLQLWEIFPSSFDEKESFVQKHLDYFDLTEEEI